MADESSLDQRRFEVLYLRLEKPVFNVVYRWLWSADDARDVTQEAFMKVWAARARVRPETVEPLVFKSALNLASNRLRVKRVRRFFSLDDAADAVDLRADAVANLSSAQQRLAVRRAIEALPTKLREVVVLCELSGLSTSQIAEALGIPPGTVGSRKHQAMALLEQALGPMVEEVS
ncbi:MAG: RNA polymerase sigma factor [Myxococcus sp.]|nr:RNA polymerase sigma factor [Myxococcus sp.]